MANEVIIHVKGDTADAEQKVGGLRGAIGSVAKIAGGIIVAEGLAKLPGLVSGITSTARDLELQMKKAGIVFGDQIGVVQAWADESAAAMGLSERQATNLAASFGDLLIPMGFTREQAAAMSTDVVGLSGALSEWSGGQRSSAEVSDILAKAMLGEREGLKELGISINDADVKGRLLKKGQQDLTGAALQQATAVATQELIFEKSTDAQTAFAEGSDTTARKQAKMKAKIQEAKESLALGLAPTIATVTSLLATGLVPAIGIAGDVLGTLKDAVSGVTGFFREHKELLPPLAGAIVTLLIPSIIGATAAAWAYVAALLAQAVAFIAANAPLIAVALAIGGLILIITLLVKHWDEVTAFVKGAWNTAITFVTDKATMVKKFLLNIFQTIKDWVSEHWPEIAVLLSGPFAPLVLLATDAFGIRSALVRAFNAIMNFFRTDVKTFFTSTVPGWFTDMGGKIFEGIKGALTGAAGLAGDMGTAVWNAIKGFINDKFINPINTFIGEIKSVGAFGVKPFSGLPTIPTLHKGGIVPGRPGEEVFAVLQAGERVIPAFATEGRSGMSGLAVLGAWVRSQTHQQIRAILGFIDRLPDANRFSLGRMWGAYRNGQFVGGFLGMLAQRIGARMFEDISFRFHQGGVVPGRPGEEVLALLQAGERVIPRSGPDDADDTRRGNTYIDTVVIQGDARAGLAALQLAKAT